MHELTFVRRFFVGIALAMMTVGAAAAGPLEDGIAAAQSGDYATALSLWGPLADEGDRDAQYGLGILHINGAGVPQDDAEAAKWFRSAAEQGLADAQFNLGVAYLTGRGVPKDNVESVKWLLPAAEQGHSAAQFNVGRAYSVGDGVSRDLVMAHMWLSLAATRGRDRATQLRNLLPSQMSPEEIAEAERLALKWKPIEER